MNYESQKRLLQIELLKVQQWVKQRQQKIIIIFEGRDAAGKGGAIKRFIERMNPRGCNIAALGTPTDKEKSQWYFQRYAQHLPSGGEIVLFDRSWYNRAGVEKVMGFCSEREYQTFLAHAPQFEEMLVDSGTVLIKFWFSVSKEEQAKRFKSRQTDPLKQWKLSPIDLEAQNRWEEYSQARDTMFAHTHTQKAPWVIIDSNDKRIARLNSMRYVLNFLDYTNKDKEAIGDVEPGVISYPNIAFSKPNQEG
jgi:polyphosphate kinase 2